MHIFVSQNLPVGLPFISTVTLEAWFKVGAGPEGWGKRTSFIFPAVCRPSPQTFVSKETKLPPPWEALPYCPCERAPPYLHAWDDDNDDNNKTS